MSSDAAVSPPTRIPHPSHGVIWKILLGADKLCHVLGNAVVGCEVCGLRGRRGQWTLKDEEGITLVHSSIHFNCHKVVILLTFTPV